MKKIILLFLMSLFLFQTNNSFANLTPKQEKLKIALENAFNTFDKKISKKSNEEQLKKLNLILSKIEKILDTKKLSVNNIFVLNQLKEVINKKISSLTQKNINTDVSKNSNTDNEIITKEAVSNVGAKIGGVNTEEVYSKDAEFFGSLTDYDKQRMAYNNYADGFFAFKIGKDGLPVTIGGLNKQLIEIKAGPVKGVNDLFYDTLVKNYNKAISYYKDGGLLGIKENEISPTYNRAYQAFKDPVLNKISFKKFEIFGYYEENGVVKYDPKINKYKDTIQYFNK